ncbi:unnamed protein product [Amoebophrya sp. A25]|nr:unnamed protein product [Amoebophrya sp. A25]|eukprot:GSA25T00002088001.1
MLAAMRLNLCEIFDECRDIGIDGTVNVTQSIIGDIPAGKTGATSNKCLTLKGRTAQHLASSSRKVRALKTSWASCGRLSRPSIVGGCSRSAATRRRSCFLAMRPCVNSSPTCEQ